MKFLLLLSEERLVWSSEEKGVTYVCLRCVVSSPSVVRYIKVGWRWSRLKGVVMNSFLFVLQFRMCQSRRVHHFIAVWGNLLFSRTLYILGTRNELQDYSLTTHNSENSLFAALRRFVLGAARLVVSRLVGFGDAIA